MALMNSTEHNKELLSQVDVEALVTELERRNLSPEQIERLQTLAKAQIDKLKTKAAGRDQNEAVSVGFQELTTSIDQEAKKWAEIIRTKGVGIVEFWGLDKNWLIDGKPITEFAEDGKFVSEKSFVSIGGFGNYKEILGLAGESTYGKKNFDRIPGGYGREAAFVAVAPQSNPVKRQTRYPLPMIYEKKVYEFNYIMSQSNTPVIFMFALPPDEGIRYLEAVKTQPDLIEATFQQIYPGLTGENQLRRRKADKVHFMDVSWVGKPKYEKPEIKVGSLQFSHPIGEV